MTMEDKNINRPTTSYNVPTDIVPQTNKISEQSLEQSAPAKDVVLDKDNLIVQDSIIQTSNPNYVSTSTDIENQDPLSTLGHIPDKEISEEELLTMEKYVGNVLKDVLDILVEFRKVTFEEFVIGNQLVAKQANVLAQGAETSGELVKGYLSKLQEEINKMEDELRAEREDPIGTWFKNAFKAVGKFLSDVFKFFGIFVRFVVKTFAGEAAAEEVDTKIKEISDYVMKKVMEAVAKLISTIVTSIGGSKELEATLLSISAAIMSAAQFLIPGAPLMLSLSALSTKGEGIMDLLPTRMLKLGGEVSFEALKAKHGEDFANEFKRGFDIAVLVVDVAMMIALAVVTGGSSTATVAAKGVEVTAKTAKTVGKIAKMGSKLARIGSKAAHIAKGAAYQATKPIRAIIRVARKLVKVMKKLGTNLKNFNKDTLKSILTKILDSAKALGKKATWMKIGKAIMSGKSFKVIMELQGILNGLTSIVNGAYGIKSAKFMAELADIRKDVAIKKHTADLSVEYMDNFKQHQDRQKVAVRHAGVHLEEVSRALRQFIDLEVEAAKDLS